MGVRFPLPALMLLQKGVNFRHDTKRQDETVAQRAARRMALGVKVMGGDRLGLALKSMSIFFKGLDEEGARSFLRSCNIDPEKISRR